MNKPVYYLLLFVCLLLPLSAAHAQDYMSNTEVKVQGILIDASRDKLLGNYQKAIDKLEEARRISTEDGAICYELGRLYARVDNPDRSIKMLKEAINEEPQNEWYWKEIAAVYQNQGMYREAADVYKELKVLQPTVEHNYYRHAYFLVKQNKIEEAVSAYNDLQNKFGITEKIIRRKHSLYVGIGETQKAADELQQLIDAYPTQTDYVLILAEFYDQEKQTKKAQKLYKKVLDMDPTNAKAKMALVGTQNAEQNDFTVLEDLKPVFADKTVDIDLKISKLIPFLERVVNTQDKQLANKILELTELIERNHPTSAKGYAIAGDVMYHVNDLQGAKAKYKQTLAISESNFLVWENLLYIYLQTEEYDDLIDTAEEVMDIYPNKASLYYLSALGNYEKGNFDEVDVMIDQGLLMSMRDQSMQYKLKVLSSRLACQRNQVEKAVQLFEQAVQMNNKIPLAYMAKAECLLKENTSASINDAVSLLKQLVADYPLNGELHAAYGDALWKAGKKVEAKAYWNKAMEVGNPAPSLLQKVTQS